MQALAQTDHAMTVEGSFSDTAGRYEKDDRRDLREGWLTGFDNRDQLQALADQLKAAQADAAASLPRATPHKPSTGARRRKKRCCKAWPNCALSRSTRLAANARPMSCRRG